MYCERLAAALRDAPKRMKTAIPSISPTTILIGEESTIETSSSSIPMQLLTSENVLFRMSLVLLLLLLMTVYLSWRFAGKRNKKFEYTPIRDNEDNGNA